MRARMQTAKQETRFISERLKEADDEITKLKDRISILTQETGKLEVSERDLHKRIKVRARGVLVSYAWYNEPYLRRPSKHRPLK